MSENFQKMQIDKLISTNNLRNFAKLEKMLINFLSWHKMSEKFGQFFVEM